MKSTTLSRMGALLIAGLAVAPASAQVNFSIDIAPPVLPVIEQQACPVEGYIWAPGYWAYDPEVQYYWVPGDWVEPPEVGFLWTPPYWGYNDGVYAFNDGYWGPSVGFYGGIDYGFGYFGDGYIGGRWDGGIFRYNTEVSRVDVNIVHNTFADRAAIRPQNSAVRASFNGGPNGVQAKASAEQQAAAASGKRVAATSAQTSRRGMASKNRDLQASVNQGKPTAAAIQAVTKNSAQPSARSRQGTGAAATNTTATGSNNAAEKTARPTSANATNPSATENADRALRGTREEKGANRAERAREEEAAQTERANERQETKADRQGLNAEGRDRREGNAPENATTRELPVERGVRRQGPEPGNRPVEAGRPEMRPPPAPAVPERAPRAPEAEPEKPEKKPDGGRP